MPTAKDICNMGLGKIGGTRINSLNPPKTVVEGLCQSGYDQWRDSELKKRRWVFATVRNTLFPTADSPLTGIDTPYRYNVPGDMLRPVRPSASLACQWVQRGQFLYSRGTPLNLEYIRRVPESEINDPLFVDVLAWRIAVELVEPTTQSDTKFQKAVLGYQASINEAAALNAFILEPQMVNGVDADYAWVSERLGYV